MALTLYGHPFSSYCQKVLIALYEHRVPFELRLLAPDDERTAGDHAALWPLRRMPVLVDGDRVLVESSVIVEHVDLHHRGTERLLPDDPRTALVVRMQDRIFDNYVMAPMQKVVLNAIRPSDHRDPYGVEEARALLDATYRWLDGTFSLADCAAAPSLFYADWVHPIDPALANLRAYRERLLARPSFARAVDEARPYRPFFPLGAPDRD